MAAFYFDASAAVKRYVRESGTAWTQAIADPAGGNLTYLARISAVEVTSAIVWREHRRTRRDGRPHPIPPGHGPVEYRLLEVTPPLLTAAILLAETHALRAYDAVQLAVVAELHAHRTAAELPAVTLVSADQELNAAAVALGLLLEDPNNHP